MAAQPEITSIPRRYETGKRYVEGDEKKGDALRGKKRATSDVGPGTSLPLGLPPGLLTAEVGRHYLF